MSSANPLSSSANPESSSSSTSVVPDELIVPVDGSQTSFAAFDVAVVLARRLGVGIRLVEVAFDPDDVDIRTPQLEDEVRRHLDGAVDVDVTIEMPLTHDTVAAAVETVARDHPDALVVMASAGSGRSAAIFGSVAQDLLRRIADPVLVVGPKVGQVDFTGPVIAPVDDSRNSEAALPLAMGWAAALDTTPWLINVIEETVSIPDDVSESGQLARLARDLEQQFHRQVGFEQLRSGHGTDGGVTRTIVEDAEARGAALIVASTHGRTGLLRVTMGSIASGLVRQATCPVMVMRPNADATA